MIKNLKEHIRYIEEMTLKGQGSQLPLPTLENVEEVSKLKSQHFSNLAISGLFPSWMNDSSDRIGYALSKVEGEGLQYFAGVNTLKDLAETTEQNVPAGYYLILEGAGGSSRQLFDQLVTEFFSKILPEYPEIYKEDSFIIEALMNGNPMDAIVELRIPIEWEEQKKLCPDK